MSEKEEDTWKELSIVFLGWHSAGKTSVINTILSSNEALQVTGQCVKREGDVIGKKVTLIDTPGWWKGNNLRDSPELVKLELVHSLSLCSHGPLAFLLVVDVNLLLTEKNIDHLEQHVQILGDKVWDHTIVVFTKDLVKNVTADQQMQSRDLKRLLEKCGDRFHVFNNTDKGNQTQIAELFEKIEDVTRRNVDNKFEINTKMLKDVQETLDDVQMKAEARRLKVFEKRSTIKNKAYVHQLEELRVVLLGWVMSGKSSAGNTILNREAFTTGNRTTACERQYGNVAGRQMTVLDTAGWWKFFQYELNPDWVKSTIFESVSQCKKSPHAILLVLPAYISFKEEQRRIIEENMAIFGEQIWRHTIVLFSRGDLLGDVMIEQYIEKESEALRWLIEKCGNRYHVFDNAKRDNRAQVTELLEKIEEMVAANCLFSPDPPVVRMTQETKPEVLLDLNGEEMIEEALGFLLTEWNKRSVKLREKLEKLMEEEMGSTQFNSNQSHHHHLNFNTDAVNVRPGKRDVRNKVGDNITEQLLSILDREWCRHEAIVMENVHEILRWCNETSSVVSEEEIQASVDKVLWWLPNTEDFYSGHTEKKRKATL